MAYRIEQTGAELQGILDDAVLTKQGLENEVARAQAAEGVLQENIDSEAGERQSADALLAGNIGTEVARAQQAENDLGARVDANAAGVAAEVARAQEAEGQVWDTLNDEILTRQSQDAALQGNIEREAGLREAGDGQLQGEIDAISGKIPSAASEMNQLADKQYVQDSIGDAPTREEVEEIKAVIPAAASESNKLVDTATFDDVASTVATLQGLYAELRDGKADKAATLAGYGIEDAYTKDAVDEMIGALSRNEIVVGPLPQTGEEGVIYRVPGNGYYTDYMYYDGSFMELAQYSMEFDQTQVGYFTCDTEAGTAAKTVSAAGYTLAVGGSMHIKMTNANTAANATLNINGTGAKALFYDGEQASSANSWEEGDVIVVYYDGTQYQATNSLGGGGEEVIKTKITIRRRLFQHQYGIRENGSLYYNFYDGTSMYCVTPNSRIYITAPKGYQFLTQVQRFTDDAANPYQVFLSLSAYTGWITVPSTANALYVLGNNSGSDIVEPYYYRESTASDNENEVIAAALTDLEGKIPTEEEKPELTVDVVPSTIYVVCNDNVNYDDYNETRQYSARLYLDHLFRNRDSLCKMWFKESGNNAVTFYSLLNGWGNEINGTSGTTDVESVNRTFTIQSEDYADKNITVSQISVRNKATVNKPVRLLCFGDSNTSGLHSGLNAPYPSAPRQYWQWIKALFEMDRQENGGTGYFFESLGIMEQEEKGSLAPSVAGAMPFDVKFNGFNIEDLTASAIGVSGGKTTTFLSDSRFLNNGVFSLQYFIENYRTLIVNADGTTTRCTDENKGSQVTDVDAFNICEPTHIVLELGFNEYASADYIPNMRTIINTFKSEYPDAYIILANADVPGTYWPLLYPDYISRSDDPRNLDMTQGQSKSIHDGLSSMIAAEMALAAEYADHVIYCPNFFTMPPCISASHHENDELAFQSSKDIRNRFNTHNGSYVWLHSNNAGHASWAYEIYSLIKYTLTLE